MAVIFSIVVSGGSPGVIQTVCCSQHSRNDSEMIQAVCCAADSSMAAVVSCVMAVHRGR